MTRISYSTISMSHVKVTRHEMCHIDDVGCPNLVKMFPQKITHAQLIIIYLFIISISSCLEVHETIGLYNTYEIVKKKHLKKRCLKI